MRIAKDVWFRRKHRILRGISLEIEGMVAIFGPNGSGKSTLAMILAGLWEPHKGYVEIDGESPKGKVYLAFQDARLLDISVREYLKLVGADELFEPLGIEEVLDKNARRLSIGRKKRVHLQAAFSSRHRYVILDEPEAGIDSLELVIKTIEEIRKRKTLVVISHEPEILMLADKVYRLFNGKLVEV